MSLPPETDGRDQCRLGRSGKVSEESMQSRCRNRECTPKEGNKRKKEKQYFSPNPNLSSGVAQNLMVSDVVEEAFSCFTLKV